MFFAIRPRSLKYSALMLIFLVTLMSETSISFAIEPQKAIVYSNESCHHCVDYVDDELIPILEEYDIQVIKKGFINDIENRRELNHLNEYLGIPQVLQGHITTIIDDKIILEGHVPVDLVKDVLREDNQEKFERIIIMQDEMRDVKSYQVWAFKGEIREYSINTSITEYLDWFKKAHMFLDTPPELASKTMASTILLPTVLLTGLLDGINPCAFAVILFLIGFLFTIRKTRSSIFKMGVAYISSMYLTYFLIGLGILKAVHIFGIPHFMAILAAYLVIFLGLINITGYFFPRFPIKLKIPTVSKNTIVDFIHKATIPAAVGLGVLVGICVFPCSGAIYVAIIGMLSFNATYLQAVGYLLLYNLMFVMPLFVVLFATSNKAVVQKINEWEQSKSMTMRFVSGLLMVVLGLIILLWFT